MLFVILSRGIDLSVGSILAVAGMFAGLIGKQEFTVVNVALAFGLPILLGFFAACSTARLIAWVRLPPLIVTLGTMYAFRGFIVWYHVNPIYQLQAWYPRARPGEDRACSHSGDHPVGDDALASVVLNRTRFGRYVYAIGGNEDAARASGINVKLVKLGVYSISGFYLRPCGAGLHLSARRRRSRSREWDSSLWRSRPSWSGGASLFGGRGSVGKTLVGALIMQVVQSGLVMLDVPSPIQQTTLGFIIIIAVGVDMYRPEPAQQREAG